MNTRPSIVFDQIFSKLFFEIKAEEDLDGKFPHEVPEDCPKKLESFLASAKGKLFLKALELIQAKLVTWCNRNGVNPARCDYLTRYINYSGLNLEANKKHLGLYRDGVPELYNIIKLLNRGTIPTDYCKMVINHLLNDFAVCEPGAHTHIFNANLALKAYSNRSLEFMQQRKKFAEQLLLEKIKKYSAQAGWEMHYVNAVLHHFKNELIIDINSDEYIKNIHDDREKRTIFEKLCRDFVAEFSSEFNLDTFMERIASQPGLSLDVFRLKLLAGDRQFQDAQEDMERNLKFYGYETREKCFYSTHAMITMTEGQQSNICYGIRWQAEYIIHASVYNRLCNSNFITPNEYDTITIRLNNDDTDIIYLSGRTLKCAYVHTPPQSQDDNPYKPLIPYCAEVISANSNKLNEFCKFLQSGRLTEQQLLEIIEGCLRHLASNDLSALSNLSRQGLNEGVARFKGVCQILAACKPTALFYRLLVNTPYDKKITSLVNEKLIGFTQHPVALAAVLFTLSTQHYADFIKHLSVQEFKRALGSESDYAKLLFLLNTENYHAFFQALGRETWQQVISSPEVFGRLLALLPADRFTPLLQAIDADIFAHVVKDSKDMAKVFKLLSPLNYSAFYKSLRQETVKSLFGKPEQYNDYFHAINWTDYSAFINAIGKDTFIRQNNPVTFSQLLSLMITDAYDALFIAIEKDGIQRICGNIHSLQEIYSLLPKNKLATFLLAIGPYVNYSFLASIDAQIFFINMLPATDECKTIIALVAPETWPLLVPDLDTLIHLLKNVSIELLSVYLSAIGDAHLKILLVSPAAICKILHSNTGLTLDKAKKLLEITGKNIITPVIKGVDELSVVLNGTEPAIYNTFIAELNDESIWSILLTGNNIFAILNNLQQADSEAGFLRALAPASWTRILSTPERYATAASCIINYPALTSVMEYSTLVSHLNTANSYNLVLDIIPEDNLVAFIKSLPSRLVTTVCQDADSLGKYLAVMGADLYDAFLQHIDADTLYKILKGERPLTVLARALTNDALTQFLFCIAKRVLQPNLRKDTRTLARVIEEVEPQNYKSLLLDRLDFAALLYFDSYTAIINQLLRNKPENIEAFIATTANVVLEHCVNSLNTYSKNKKFQFHSLYDFVCAIPAELRVSFLSKMTQASLQIYLKNLDDKMVRESQILYDLLGQLPEKDRIILVRLAGRTNLIALLHDPDFLPVYLKQLPPDTRAEFLELVGADKLRSLITNLKQLIEVLLLLPCKSAETKKYPLQCRLFDLLGTTHLRSIMGYKEKNQTKDMTIKITRLSAGKTLICYPLLIALTRGYSEIRNGISKEHDHFWGELGMFSAQDKNTKLFYAKKLEEAIMTHNHDDFFSLLNKDNKSRFDENTYLALARGDISAITDAFKHHHETHHRADDKPALRASSFKR